jgi:hypothetical protein
MRHVGSGASLMSAGLDRRHATAQTNAGRTDYGRAAGASAFGRCCARSTGVGVSARGWAKRLPRTVAIAGMAEESRLIRPYLRRGLGFLCPRRGTLRASVWTEGLTSGLRAVRSPDDPEREPLRFAASGGGGELGGTWAELVASELAVPYEAVVAALAALDERSVNLDQPRAARPVLVLARLFDAAALGVAAGVLRLTVTGTEWAPLSA